MSMSDNGITASDPIPPHASISIAPTAVATPTDTECLVHNLETGTTYRLNDVGTRIWELLETGSTIADTTAVIRSEYRVPDDISSDQIAADITAIVTDLHRYGLVHVGAS
jgi:hypothetical protein